MNQNRHYRRRIQRENLTAFQVMVSETDLMIQACRPLEDEARELVLESRRQIETYISRHPEFLDTLTPWRLTGPAPETIRAMVHGAQCAGVGPMAAVAGAVAEQVGRGLLKLSPEVVVENGGDIFLKTHAAATVAVYAADSPMSMRVGLRVDSSRSPMAICTSSGTVGHSLSLGRADAVCVLSHSCPLADAAATAIGNRVHSPADIEAAIDFGRRIDGVDGIVVIMGEALGGWGQVQLVAMTEKRG